MTQTLDVLEKLVAFPTISRDSNLELIEWARTLLQSVGFEVTLIPSPCGTKAGLFARIGPDCPGGICLSGHTDVVPTEGQNWTRDPFKLTRSETHVYGRGTTDMKGFVASALALAQRVDPSRLIAPLEIVLSYDEEIGCVGIREMLPRLGAMLGKPQLVIVGEPTSMQVALGQKGKTTLQVRCGGQAGHSALAPKFVNAIEVASQFVLEMRGLQQKLAEGPTDPDYDIPHSTVHVGKIFGGRAVNIVADETVLDMEARFLPTTDGSDILQSITEIASKLEQETGSKISIREINRYPGLNTIGDSAALKTAVTLSGQETTTKVAFGTEAGYFASLGLTAVIIGPGDMARDGHKPDEALAIEQLSQCDAMMDRVLATLL